MKLQYVPHDDAPRGIASPVLSSDDQWLIPPMFVEPNSPSCVMILRPHQYLTLHEIRDRHWLMWMKSHPDFQIVNSSPHPDVVMRNT